MDILGLQDMIERKLIARFEKRYPLTIIVKKNERFITISVYDRLLKLATTQILDKDIMIDYNYLDAFDFYINSMIDDLEYKRKEEEMKKQNLEAVRTEAITAARDLHYKPEYLDKLIKATTESEISSIMRKARGEKFGWV